MNEIDNIAIEKAIEESRYNLKNNYNNGGPFGAVIVCNGKIICSCHNTVVESHDATAHAEINAIRTASKILNTHDLSNCILYTSAEPCPMCLSAIIWANIKKVYYGTNLKDAENIGFRDDFIYKYLENNDVNILDIENICHNECLELFKEYKEKEKEIY